MIIMFAVREWSRLYYMVLIHFCFQLIHKTTIIGGVAVWTFVSNSKTELPKLLSSQVLHDVLATLPKSLQE